MSVLPIYLYGTDILRKKAKSVQNVNDEIIKLIIDMFETMHKAQGIGLAATQVGSLDRVIVIDVSDLEDMKHIKPLTLINPEVVNGIGKVSLEEGCLSIPDIRDEVDRDEKIVVRFRDTNFKETELEADGVLARVILHEIDHLNGVLFLDYLPKEKLKLHKDKLKQIQHGEIEVSYPVIPVQQVVKSK
ncbi:MAG: peptide deformylase [Bacteroidota bacterium]